MRLDRQSISFENMESQHADEVEYWSEASVEEKIAMITYLRECFYGPKATTGRLQRIFTILKQKQG